jgi:mRNA-degrading endonuclease RelE of RelBE toxin-antitoxin system
VAQVKRRITPEVSRVTPISALVESSAMRQTPPVFQVIFNEISAAEISQLPTLEQLEVLSEFQVKPEDLDGIEDLPPGAKFGQIERDGKKLYRYRASDVRIYFEVSKDHQSVVVHRVLSKNTFQDFLYRANLPVGDDDSLAGSKQFWALIEEGERARQL